MADEPIWEWIDGDPDRTAQWSFASGMLGGAALTVWAVVFLKMLGFDGDISYAAHSVLFQDILLLVVAVPFMIFLNWFPRRFAVLRLGISAVGLRLQVYRGLSVAGRFTVKWSLVAGVGPDWVEVW
jgi:hypothetical protein